MSVEIAWKQNILVTDFHLLKSLLFVLGFGSQAFVCGFSRQNINSAQAIFYYHQKNVLKTASLQSIELRGYLIRGYLWVRRYLTGPVLIH